MSRQWQARENWLLNELKEDPDCLEATRASRSLGAWDLCAVMKEETWFIQMKSSLGITSEDRRRLQVLSSSLLHRTVWLVICKGSCCDWQMYLDSENESGKSAGWYVMPDGPFGTIGRRINTKE